MFTKYVYQVYIHNVNELVILETALRRNVRYFSNRKYNKV